MRTASKAQQTKARDGKSAQTGARTTVRRLIAAMESLMAAEPDDEIAPARQAA